MTSLTSTKAAALPGPHFAGTRTGAESAVLTPSRSSRSEPLSIGSRQRDFEAPGRGGVTRLPRGFDQLVDNRGDGACGVLIDPDDCRSCCGVGVVARMNLWVWSCSSRVLATAPAQSGDSYHLGLQRCRHRDQRGQPQQTGCE